jgi:D-aminopeptidase
MDLNSDKVFPSVSGKVSRRKFLLGGLAGIPLLPWWKELAAESLKLRGAGAAFVDEPRKRLRELGIVIGDLPPGKYNAITDVKGVMVGSTTIIKDYKNAKGETKSIRTGVTAILPNGGNIYHEHLFAGFFNQNGWGEMTGIAPIEAYGILRTPIYLTGTYNVGIVYDAAITHMLKECPDIMKQPIIPSPVVAECFDSYLSDVEERAITEEDVLKAIAKAKSGTVEEGAIGGGTGHTTFGFKGGIGTSSRMLPEKDGGYTVGVLVMSNTARLTQLRVDGVPVGKEFRKSGYTGEEGCKSIILIAGTDAPLFSFQLKKVGKRVAMGLAQMGAISGTGSGDIILAFSTANRIPLKSKSPLQKITAINDNLITPVYQATVEATQEAILNAMTMARTITGRKGYTAQAIPLHRLVEIMKKYYRLERRKP